MLTDLIILKGQSNNPNEKVISSKLIIFKKALWVRAGYGESDPNPKRSVKSEASDIEELAEQLQLGSKYYVIGVSLMLTLAELHQTHSSKACRSGLVVPFVNYKWRSLPADLT
ncbi:hypothetical protein HAX54_012472 [Datura stramonium]|uniref:Uncharacterized protein n=1 Tax=Datura stramonium TaxID=4076 RepID=A0ABS8TKS5_DATST|nr:hypothetical protein [Datura stramonium]